MGLIHLIRLASFGTVLVFSIIVLGLSANIDALVHASFDPASLALAVSVITIFTMVPIIALEHLRKGMVTSLVFVELIWVGVLWVLWLASGGEAASLGVIASRCSSDFLSSGEKTLCSSIVAITAFSFLNWLILMGWFVTLLIFGVMGNHWNNSVPDTDLTRRHASSTGPAPSGYPNMAAAPGAASPYGAYPPQQAPQGHPQQQAQGYQGYPQQGQLGTPQQNPQSYPASPMSGPVQHPAPGHTPGSVPV